MAPPAASIIYDRSLRTVDSDGRLRVEVCTLSKACISPYLGREIPGADQLGLEPDKIYKLYRDSAELLKAAPTFSNLPLLIVHKAVSADKPEKRLVVGCTGDAFFEAPYLKSSLALWDAEGIAAVESGAQEQLSCGYRYKAVMIPGSVDGEPYDGRMVDIEGNHVALVELGRIGPEAMVADSLFAAELLTMKHSKRITALKPFLASGIDLVALDAAIEKEDNEEKAEAATKGKDKAAKDAAEAKEKEEKEAKDRAAKDKAEAEEKEAKDHGYSAKDWAEMSEGDRKKARDAKRARDGLPMSPEGGAKKPSGLDKEGAHDASPITKADLEAAVEAGIALATQRTNELHAAREAVKPYVGEVALDSAASVYEFALNKLGIDTKGVHSSAFAAMLKLVKPAKAAPVIATDSTGKVVQFDLSRIRQA